MTHDERVHELLYSCEDREELAERIARLEGENAKLRELVRTMAYCMQDGRDCDGCPMNGAGGELDVDPLFACDGLYACLHELGVVDDA